MDGFDLAYHAPDSDFYDGAGYFFGNAGSPAPVDFGNFGFTDAFGGGFGSTGGGTNTQPGGGIAINIGSGGGAPRPPSTNEKLTVIVDGYESQLRANLAQWTVGGLGASAALGLGWQIMDAMVTACRQYGAAGEKTAAERDRRINPAMLRWDWIAYYIDPITGGQTTLPPVPGGGATGVGTGGNSTIPPGNTPYAIAGFPMDPAFIMIGLFFLYIATRR